MIYGFVLKLELINQNSVETACDKNNVIFN